MKLTAIIIEIPEDHENEYCDYTNLIVDKINEMTHKKCFIGQDDGKFCIAVEPEHDEVFSLALPGHKTTQIEKDHYPWDWNYIRDIQIAEAHAPMNVPCSKCGLVYCDHENKY